MYLRRLRVRNFRRVADIALDVTDASAPRMWTVIIGENGTAKTTLLQAVALAAMGARRVGELAGSRASSFVRRGQTDALSVDARFDFTPSSRALRAAHPNLADESTRSRLSLDVNVSLRNAHGVAESSSRYAQEHMRGAVRASIGDPLDAARTLHQPGWFVAAASTRRTAPPAAEPWRGSRSHERLASLFGSDDLSAFSVFSANEPWCERAKCTTLHHYRGLMAAVVAQGGRKLFPSGTANADELSDGEASMLAWVSHLIGHALCDAGKNTDPVTLASMEGAMLLDGIEANLHPSAQAVLVPTLRAMFPRMQFIATTNSPAVVSAMQPGEVVRLAVDASGDVVLGDDCGDARPMTASEIYRGWFGLDRLTPNPKGKALREYLVLAGDPTRSRADTVEMQRLAEELTAAGIALPLAPRG